MTDPRLTTADVARRAKAHRALGDPVRLAVADRLALSDAAPQDLAADLGISRALLSHHLGALRDAGLVTEVRSNGDGRRKYLRLDRSVLDGLLARAVIRANHVLFVCTGNAARSQLAEALWAARSPVPASSAGTAPATAVHDGAILAGAELGLDLQGRRPRALESVTIAPDLVVSVCDVALESGVPFDTRHVHWSIPDPVAEGTPAAFRAAAATIAGRVDTLASAVAPAA